RSIVERRLPSRSSQTCGAREPGLPFDWLERDGKRLSTIDLFRGAFVLLAGADGQAWIDAARSSASHFNGVQLDTHVVDVNVTAAYGISSSGASLVRPDGFIAWRATSAAADAGNEIERVLRRILAR